MSTRLYEAFTSANAPNNHMPDEIYEIEGMSGRAYRNFLNRLVCSGVQTRYLEVGSWKGSTVVAALTGNECKAMCIDNWSEFGGPKDEFMDNLERYGVQDRVDFKETDFRKADYGDVGLFDVFLFDGPHAEVDHYDGITLPQPALKQEYVLLVDDWNWQRVRLGTLQALSDCGSTIEFAIEIKTTEDDTHAAQSRSEWHNGCFAAVIKKSA